MKRKPLKISWRSWCLYKLANRDYSAHEMRQMIIRRASESDQEVDPTPVVNQLIEEGAIDDERYLKNQLSMATSGQQIKGPREIRRKLLTTGGIPEELIENHVNDADRIWFHLAEKVTFHTLAEKGYGLTDSTDIPLKMYNSLKQKLYRKGFTGEQVAHAMNNLVPKAHQKTPIPGSDIQRQVEKLSLSGKGPRAILSNLKQKGAEESDIQSALDNLEIDWIEQAKDQAERKYGTGKKRTLKDQKKCFDYLTRKGYTYDQIHVALEE